MEDIKKGPLIISIDDFKLGLDGYVPERAADFHSASAKLADKAFKEAVAVGNLKRILLIGGGSASGKTEYIHTFLTRRRSIIFDSTLSTIEGARIKIGLCKQCGKRVEVNLVIPDSLKLAFAAFLVRDRKFPDEVFYKTHSGCRKTVLWIAETYPEIKVRIIESTVINDQTMYHELKFNGKMKLIKYLQEIQYTAKVIRERVIQ